jgi:hypothetical protein
MYLNILGRSTVETVTGPGGEEVPALVGRTQFDAHGNLPKEVRILFFFDFLFHCF